MFRAFDIKVFTVFRLEFEARKRSAVSKVLPSTINQHTHSHTHYNNNSNNNFKYACCCLCLSSCIIRSNSIQRRRRKSRMRRGGEWREVPVKRNCHSLHLPPQFRILCAIQSVAHICQSSAGSRATEKERGRTKAARGIAGLAPLSVAQLHFILRVSLQQRTT